MRNHRNDLESACSTQGDFVVDRPIRDLCDLTGEMVARACSHDGLQAIPRYQIDMGSVENERTAYLPRTYFPSSRT